MCELVNLSGFTSIRAAVCVTSILRTFPVLSILPAPIRYSLGKEEDYKGRTSCVCMKVGPLGFLTNDTPTVHHVNTQMLRKIM
jgi:hypothetical protein